MLATDANESPPNASRAESAAREERFYGHGSAPMMHSVTRARRRSAGLAVVAISTLLLTGCVGEDLDADSSCEDYLNASRAEQDQAVQDVATDLGAGNAVTPLGRPNIDYLCVQAPAMTLGEVVELTG